MKTELREEVSGHSSVSDVESDSDSPTEVNKDFISHFVRGRRTLISVLYWHANTTVLCAD